MSRYRAIPKRSRNAPAPAPVAYSDPTVSVVRETMLGNGTTVVTQVGVDMQRPDLRLGEDAKAVPSAPAPEPEPAPAPDPA